MSKQHASEPAKTPTPPVVPPVVLPPTTPQEAEKTREPVVLPGSSVGAGEYEPSEGVNLKSTAEEGGTFPPSTPTTKETERAGKDHPKAEKTKIKAIEDPRAVSRVESMETEHPAETGQSTEGHHHGKQADTE